MAKQTTHQTQPNREKNPRRQPTASGEKDASVNRNASHNYFLLEKFEAGVVLTGTEVKSIRTGKTNLKDAYGLIKWKMDLELGHAVATAFTNPDFVSYAQSFGARGYSIAAANELLPVLREALAADTVSVIACPVDYSENLRLTDALGELSGPF